MDLDLEIKESKNEISFLENYSLSGEVFINTINKEISNYTVQIAVILDLSCSIMNLTNRSRVKIQAEIFQITFWNVWNPKSI